MQDSNPDLQIQRLATACICNLSADPPLKDAIAAGGAIPHLSKLLETDEDSVDARAATAHAAATLWRSACSLALSLAHSFALSHAHYHSPCACGPTTVA
eukprot:978845-Rhodomonas_salina.3